MTTDPYQSERLAPHSVEAEEAVLGAALINPDVYPLVSTYLTSDDFFILRNAWVWDAIGRVAQQGEYIDNVTVCEELRSHQQLDDIGGSAYITYLINSTPTSLHANGYARVIEDRAIRRRLLSAASDMAGFATMTDLPLDDALTKSQVALDRVALTRDTEETAVSVGEIAFEQYEKRLGGEKPRRIPTGIKALDYGLGGGFANRTMHIIGGLQGTGKSALAKQIALYAGGHRHTNGHFAKAEVIYPTLYYLLEGDKSLVTDRMLAEMLNVDSYYIENGLTPNHPACPHCKDGDEITKRTCNCSVGFEQLWSQRLNEAHKQLFEYPIKIDDRPQTLTTWKRRIRREFKRNHYSLVIVDHLGLMSEQGMKEYELEGAFTHACVNLAKELNTCFLVLHQVNKQGGGLTRPITINDYKGNGAITQDAYSIIAIHLENITVIDHTGEQVTRKGSNGSLIGIKNRGGREDFLIPVHFRKPITRFDVAIRD